MRIKAKRRPNGEHVPVKDFMELLEKKLGVSKEETFKYYKTIVETIINGLNRDGYVSIQGFASFKTYEKKVSSEFALTKEEWEQKSYTTESVKARFSRACKREIKGQGTYQDLIKLKQAKKEEELRRKEEEEKQKDAELS